MTFVEVESYNGERGYVFHLACPSGQVLDAKRASGFTRAERDKPLSMSYARTLFKRELKQGFFSSQEMADMCEYCPQLFVHA
jgi:hypothetical protein